MRSSRLAWTIALIAVVVSLGSTLTCVSLHSSSQAKQQSVESLRSDVAELRRQLDDEEEASAKLREMLGFSDATPLDEIQKLFDQDLISYAGGIDEPLRNYRGILKQLSIAHRQANAQLAELIAANDELRTKFLETETMCQKQIETVRDLADRLADDLSTQREKSSEDRVKLEQLASELGERLERQQRERYRLVADYNGQLRQFQQKLAQQRSINKELATRLKPPADQPLQADGFIAWTDPRTESVWINLGSDDGLKPHTRFVVFEATGNTITKGNPKATVQIVKVVGSHLSEAVVTEAELDDPPVPGDAVYSSVWDPGQISGVALAGLIDVDDDGSSDFSLVNPFITENGGKIDLIVEPDGKREGQLTADTTMLVLGKRPDSSNPEGVTAYEQVIEEAKTLGVQRIGLKEFLRNAGWKPAKIEPLSESSR